MGSHEQLVEFEVQQQANCSRVVAYHPTEYAVACGFDERRPRLRHRVDLAPRGVPAAPRPRRRARVRPRRPPAVLRLARRRPVRVRRAALVPAVPLVHRRHPRRLAVHRDRARRQRHRRRRPAVEGTPPLRRVAHAAARAAVAHRAPRPRLRPLPGPSRLDRQPRAALVPALRRVGRPRRAARPLCRRARRAPNGVRGPRGLSQRPLPRERRQRPDRQRVGARGDAGGPAGDQTAELHRPLRSRDVGLLRARRPVGHLRRRRRRDLCVEILRRHLRRRGRLGR